jgi:hypothetical protein
VWKEVLASLVKGKKPGEVTTLWIQREIINPLTGRKELEALERIPMKLVEEVTLKEFSPDHQFSVKVFNNADEYVFRCNNAPADAMMWAQTLKKYQWIAQGIIPEEEEEEKKETSPSPSHNPQPHPQGGPSQPTQQPSQPPASASASSDSSSMSISELRAICHGAGINTAGMERQQLINAAAEVRRRGTYFDRPGYHPQPAAYAVNPPSYPPAGHASVPSSGPPQEHPTPPPTEAVPEDEPMPETQSAPFDEKEDVQPATAAPPPTESVVPPAPAPASAPAQITKLSIKELRAICHGAGINTMGMERRELEAAAEDVKKRGTYFDPPPGMHAPTEEEIKAQQEEFRRQEALRAQQEQMRLQQEHEVALRRQQQEEAQKRAEEEARKRAEEEQTRRQQEAQTRYQQQQAAWERQRQEEAQRKRQAEQKAAEERRQREEAYRKQQQWAQQSSGQHPQHQPAWNQQHAHQGYPQQHPQQGHQHYPQQQQHRQHPQQPQQPHPQQQYHHHQQQQQQQQQQHHHSAASEKYAAMANQTGDGGQAIITRIKHDILIQWALQPPQLQMLRPIDTLVTTIHKVFPPALGVSGHDYFQKWKPITLPDIVGASGLPDDEKLKKSVRKIRFFLHPDKRPHDLNEEQKFVTKMLWDITSDAWEEFQKQKEDLDWVTT